MNTENNFPRKTVASILAAVGVALISRLPQLLPGQMVVTWYQNGYMLVGITIIIIALLILIFPLNYWNNAWRFLMGSPAWILRAYLWKRYGPKYTIDGPIIESQVLENIPEIRYRAKFEISIKNKCKPLKIDLDSSALIVKQKTEWSEITELLGNPVGKGTIELKPHHEDKWEVVVNAVHRGNLKYCLDLQKAYRWRIERIWITLPSGGMRELHKGNLRKRRQV